MIFRGKHANRPRVKNTPHSYKIPGKLPTFPVYRKFYGGFIKKTRSESPRHAKILAKKDFVPKPAISAQIIDEYITAVHGCLQGPFRDGPASFEPNAQLESVSSPRFFPRRGYPAFLKEKENGDRARKPGKMERDTVPDSSP